MDTKEGDLITKTTGHTRSKILQYGYILEFELKIGRQS